jgi:hypothetical protein
MHNLIRHLKIWYPDIEACPRAFVRVWAGSMYYLDKHASLLVEAQHRGLLDDVIPPVNGTGSSETEISSPIDAGSGVGDADLRVGEIPRRSTRRVVFAPILELVPRDARLLPLFA